MITLHESNITSFPHDNGIGILKDVIRAYAEEELNGLFEFYMEYDSEGHLVNELKEERIIKAKAQDKLGYQLFRIYSITKHHENDNLIIRAQHITYDLADNFVEKLEANNLTKKQVMELIGSSTVLPHPFNITSPNTTTRSSTKLYRTNPLQMVGGIEGSVLQIWGGQIERDNFNLILHDRRGSDDGVKVTYEKNITGLEATFDISGLVTRIFPFVFIEGSDNEPDRLITVSGKYIDSPHINDYEKIYIKPIDYSNDERIDIQDKTDAQIRQQLTNIASKYFEETGNDKIKVDMEVQFEHLWETEEYKDLAVLELVGMGDTVTIEHSRLKVNATAIVNYIRYDCIAEKNEEVRLGSVKARLTDNVNRVVDVAEKVEQAQQTANQAIRAANGKNTIYYGPDEPTNGIEGDLWFRVVDGEYTRTYRHDGIQWQLVLSVDVRDAINEAQQAKDDAQSAVDRANQATQQATNAINQAQIAFDEAQQALGVANNAMTQATSAFSKAQEGFDLAQDAIDELANLEIGGRNLYQNSKGPFILEPRNSGSASDNYNFYRFYCDMELNETYTISADIEITHGDFDEVTVYPYQGGERSAVSIPPNGRIKYTFVKTSETIDSVLIYAGLIGLTRGQGIIIRNVKIEKGNKATDWTPAPEDVDQKIDVVANDLDGLSVIVSNNVGEITSIQATTQGLRTDVRNLQGDVSSVTQLANALQTRMTDAEGNITTLQQTSSSLAGRLTDAEDNITTLTATVNGLQTQVSDNAGNISSLTQIAQGLQTQVTDIEGNVSTLQQTAQGLQSSVTNLQNELDGLEIGGRNLFSLTQYQAAEKETGPGDTIGYVFQGEPHTSYILSTDIPRRENLYDVFFDIYPNQPSSLVNGVAVGEPRIITTDDTGKMVIWLRKTNGVTEKDVLSGDYHIKLEKGNKATDWSPAPEDIDHQFSVITQTIDSITTRIGDAEGNITALQQTSSSLAARLTDAEGNITTLTATVSGLQTTVTNVQGDVSSVTQLANALQVRMTNAEGNISTLTQTASSLQSTVSSLQSEIDNIDIHILQGGGKQFENLAARSYGTSNVVGALVIKTPITYTYMTRVEIVGYNYQSGANDIDLTVSFYAYTNNTFHHYSYKSVGIRKINKVRLARENGKAVIIIEDVNSTWSYPKIIIKSALIGHGNPPDSYKDGWDIAFETNLSQYTNVINVSGADVQSQITQLSDAINLRVMKGDVINQINISDESILIDGKRIHITGQTTIDNGVIKSAHIESLDAGKITTGTLDAGKISVINLSANSITSGTINAANVAVSVKNGVQEVRLGHTGLESIDSNGNVRIHLGVRNLAGKGQSDPATLRFFKDGSAASASIGLNTAGTFVIGSTSRDITMELYSDRNIIMYYNELRVASKYNTSNYHNHYFIFRNVTSAQGDLNPALVPNVSGWGYLGTSSNRLWGIYVNHLFYVYLNQLSSREFKTDIQSVEDEYLQSVFDEINLVQFKYNLKNEQGAPDDKIHFGIIAEDSPYEILDDTGKQLHVNNYINVIAGSLKYQTRRINNHQDEIERLKLENQYLKQKIQQLEEMIA